jgi:hypothetical protein
MPKQPIVDPLIAHASAKLDRVRTAGPFELPSAVKDFAESAFALIREQHNRIAALERLTETGPSDGSVTL